MCMVCVYMCDVWGKSVCDCEFDQSPKLSIENPNEALGQEMILKEIGQYLCRKCNSKVGEYREFEKL